ncbi:Translocation and assembly module subunit TamA [Burkholderiales bacterium]|nr:Translocation and assembly module subunit TamA [Burkholderiales bacterium]
MPALRQNVDLVRWQDYADMTEPLLARLAREASGQARAVADAEGHFSAQATVAIDRSVEPFAVTLTLVPGEATRVRSVRVAVTGAAQDDVPAGTDAIASAQGGWLLGRGSVFRQDAWEAAKSRAVEAIRASPYASAAIARSRADVDPEAHAADLDVEIASGPPFRFGRLEVRGLVRYPVSLVRNFSTLVEGDRYSREALHAFLRRLDATGYFASVQAAIDDDPAHAGEAAVRVDVIEAPTKRIEVGVGYSTDTAYRGNLSWRDVDFAGRAIQFSVDARVESKVLDATVRFVRPPDARGWRDSAGAHVERTDIERLVTRTAYAAVRRQSVDERRQPAFGAAYYVDEQRPDGGEAVDAHALYVDGAWTRRDVDDLVAPARGHVVALQAGAGIPGISTRGFGRAIAQFQAWHPIGRASGVTLRVEAGAVLARSREGVPSTLLFRTGGDATVRGYAYQSLGVKRDGAVLPGRYYALASVEATRWFSETWGAALFVDAGNAGDEAGDLAKPAVGYGIGARMRTPIGPFRLDVAYGHDDRRVRVHFSVGLAF